MKRAPLIALAVLLFVLAGAVAWWLLRPEPAPTELVLFGNVDLREVDLAFNDSERIAAVLVQEGARVRAGQVLALADTSRLKPQLDQAVAIVAIDEANSASAWRQYLRMRGLSATTYGGGVSQQVLDAAKTAFDAAAARVNADAAEVVLLRRQLIDAQLLAPIDATVSTRLMEPGEIASPQSPVFSLAVTNPKWVRVYVTESDLGKVHPGMTGYILVDSFPNRRFSGWVGFVSPVSEFTPKNIETEDLRTSLVYEVRVFVKDPADSLRLGMPATVHLSLLRSTARTAAASNP